MKKSILLILSLLLFIPNVYALDECTPSDEYLEYLKLSEEEREGLIPPYKCKEMLNLNENTLLTNINRDLDSFLGTSVNTSRYNAKDDNIVTNVQNQYNDGTCWAFSALSVVETNAMKNGLPSYNLSEAHLAYSLLDGLYTDSQGRKGKYHSTADGGKITYPASYFFNNVGMLLESDLGYPYQLPMINSSNYIQGRHILTVDNFQTLNINDSGACSNNEIFNIKKAITEYGSVQGTINMDESLIKNNKYYYSHGSIGVDHAITIVGWDDNMSKDYFGASRNGAWIVKNSWGTNWGDNGYFYISYDDDHICQGAISYNGVNTLDYDYTYKTADMVGTTYNNYVPLTYVASKFTKKSSNNEVIKKISFASAYADYNTDYYIYITYDNNLKNTNSWELIATASSNNLGIESVYVDVPIKNDNYTIVIKYLAKTTFYMLTTTRNDDTYTLSYPTGVNYLSTNNLVSFTDMGDMFVPSAPNIFVYTNEESEDTSSIIIDEVDEEDNGISLNIVNNDSITIDSVKLYDLNNNDVTNDFDITYNGSKIIINNCNNKSGHYNIIITDASNNTCHTFYEFEEQITLSSSIKYNEELGLFIIPKNYTFTNVTNNITFKNTNYKIYNLNNTEVNNGNIGTGYSIKTNESTFYLIVKGDTNGDGGVNSGDLFMMRKHLLGTHLNNTLFLGADMNDDGTINSGDLFLLRKELLKG